MFIQDTLDPYEEIANKGIQYANCREYDHISRHSCLRQVVHSPGYADRLLALETTNGFETNSDVVYHEVKPQEENRLDLIANDYLGSASYAWVIAEFNGIEDGFSVYEGQKLSIPKELSSLFKKGEILAPVPAMQLNLGYE